MTSALPAFRRPVGSVLCLLCFESPAKVSGETSLPDRFAGRSLRSAANRRERASAAGRLRPAQSVRSPTIAPPAARSLSEIALAAGTQRTQLAHSFYGRYTAPSGRRKAGRRRPARKRAGRTPTGACAREAGGTISGSGIMTLPLSTLLPLFGFARAAGPNHWPKERSAVRTKVRPKVEAQGPNQRLPQKPFLRSV